MVRKEQGTRKGRGVVEIYVSWRSSRRRRRSDGFLVGVGQPQWSEIHVTEPRRANGSNLKKSDWALESMYMLCRYSAGQGMAIEAEI